MSPFLLLSLFLCCSFSPAAAAAAADSISFENSDEKKNVGCEVAFVIGAVIDQTSRIGKEQKIAMEMAVHDFNQWTQCSHMDLQFKDSQGTSARAISSVIDLVKKKQAHAILGTLTMQEAALVWELDELAKNIPIISLSPSATPSPLLPSQPPSFIRMSYDMAVQMECLAAIVGHFRWRKVIAIYESSSSFSADSALVTHLSESLKAVESVVEYHSAFPCMNSVLESRNYIEEELKRLRSKNVKIFTVLRSSSEFAILVFKKAKELGMMAKGYAWIVSDDFANLLDSVDSSIIFKNLEGVIGFKMNYLDTEKSVREFERRFRRKYGSEHPEEEKLSSPSIYALRAYDATWSIAKAITMANSEGKENSIELTKNILMSNFEGLSGKISFKNGALLQKPVFQIVNVIGKSYRELALWSPQFGFSEDLVDYGGAKLSIGNGLVGDLSTIYWPGGELTPPKVETFGSIENPLRIGVPAMGAFNIFVNVKYDQNLNKTIIRGFSIDVFEAAVKMLPYHLPYLLIPHYGSYDEMVEKVRNKSLDAAVGDTEIMADRYEIADFTQPYMESGLVMVVTVKPDLTKTRLIVLKVFTLKMWILIASMSLATGFVIWLNEHVNQNPDFCGPFPQQIGSMLWFSVTVLSFSHRESIKHNLSRLLLSTWLFVTVVITACFTAAITTMMTVPSLEPSIADVDKLLSMNSQVGCNGNSFIVRFLIDVLHFKPENVRKIDSIHGYPEAFEKGDIKAAFFVAPHAKVFLSEYCNGYTEAGKSYKLGGFGFVFPKGSTLAIDISEAILKVTQKGEMNELGKQLSSFSNCSSSSKGGDDDDDGLRRIGTEPFFWLFLISALLLAATFLNSMACILGNQYSIYETIQNSLIKRRIYSWTYLILLIQPWMKFPSEFLTKSNLNQSDNEIIIITQKQSSQVIELAAATP